MNDDDELRGYEIVGSDFHEYSSDDLPADPITPVEIAHQVDEIIGDGQEETRYNYLIYRFEKNGACIQARSYLSEVNEVSVLGPFVSRNSQELADEPEFFQDVLAYLKRRYRLIQVLGKEGYEVAWQHPSYSKPR